jgi:F0F1-type ATP synthase assembly protein I
VPGASEGVGAALSLGTTMAAGMIVFAGLGWWLDRARGSGVFWTVVGLLLGFGFGLYEAWKAIRQIDPHKAPQKGKDGTS